MTELFSAWLQNLAYPGIKRIHQIYRLQELLTLHKNIAVIVSTDCSLSFDAKHIFSKPTAQQQMNTGTYAADKTNKVIYMILFLPDDAQCKLFEHERPPPLPKV